MTRNASSIDNRDKHDIEELIKGLKFNALHLNYKRTFIIHGLSRESVRNTKFKIEKNGQKKEISVFDYFAKEYTQFARQYKINPNFPCVQVGSRNNAKYFPIECCYLEDGKPIN